MPQQYNALVDELVREPQSSLGCDRVRVELIGAASQTPVVAPLDIVSLQVRRVAAGANAPGLASNEADQSFAGTVIGVHNQEPSGDWSVVNITLEGYSKSLNLHPGDAVLVRLDRMLSTTSAP